MQADANAVIRIAQKAAAQGDATTAIAAGWSGKASFKAAGTSGVSAMQLAVVDDNTVLIFDKQENNPLQIGGKPVWGSLYDIPSTELRALEMQTNSFCAGGGWLSNGTMISVGGSPLTSLSEEQGEETVAGWDGLRMFTPGKTGEEVYEDPTRLRLTSKRWYPSTTRLEDGSVIIFGGMTEEGFNNKAALNNPTIEFWPPKFTGKAINSKFLVDALNTNLFPVTFLLPSGDIFVAANTLAMTYDWKTGRETRLPSLPNGVRINYPASAASALLPLTVANNWTPEVLLCGGSSAASIEAGTGLSATSPASAQCSRIVLNAAGIAAGWQTETMPEARLMGDAVITPDGQVLIINGAGTGQAGFSNVKNSQQLGIGESNAENPVFSPTLYSPLAAKGKRFSKDGLGATSIERLYHSSASLIPDGRIIIAGSNPNNDFSTKKYQTRYDVEMYSPPYLSKPRPAYTGLPSQFTYGDSFSLNVTLPANTQTVQAVVMDLGYSTHGVHMSQRWVELVAKLEGSVLTVSAPANAGLFPPGPGWVHILADGIPSEAKKVMVGDGADPPYSEAAMQGLLATAEQNTN